MEDLDTLALEDFDKSSAQPMYGNNSKEYKASVRCNTTHVTSRYDVIML